MEVSNNTLNIDNCLYDGEYMIERIKEGQELYRKLLEPLLQVEEYKTTYVVPVVDGEFISMAELEERCKQVRKQTIEEIITKLDGHTFNWEDCSYTVSKDELQFLLEEDNDAK